ncbi:hypothetical protein G5C65_37230, partial [Streptomyces sp. SB3404]|nr:hypothetical protein [Streptomyces boncukensis]
PSPSPSARPESSGAGGPAASPSPGGSPERTPDPGGGTDRAGHRVRAVTVAGGRAVFDLGPRTAALVSATPEAGWGMRIWVTPQWIRVTFARDGGESTVFCRWDDSAPRVETYTR